jgi:hypothetical protein
MENDKIEIEKLAEYLKNDYFKKIQRNVLIDYLKHKCTDDD